MTFAVRDLMVDVLPARDANSEELQLCELATQGPPGQPKPAPKPPPKPRQPGYAAATGGEQVRAAELAPLPVLREQLHQALHP